MRRALEPVVLELGRWGSLAPLPAGRPTLGADAAVLALKTLFDPDAADELELRVALRLGEAEFDIRVAAGRLEVTRGWPQSPDLLIRTEPGPLAAVLWHDRPLEQAIRAGEVELEGKFGAARRFLSLFPLPAAEQMSSGYAGDSAP